MSKRTYNIFFHLHTVSGIVITVGLYVIFFAGAFTLFFAEIEAWERSRERRDSAPGIARSPDPIDLDRLMRELGRQGYELYGRDLYIDLRAPGARQPFFLAASKDSLATGQAKEGATLHLDRETYAVTAVARQSSATLGGLLYELHFFYQLGEFGYYLSGVVSLLFLFAMVSGIIIHWKKIVSNFYLFRPYGKLKTAWTDAHTALGVIGIPFQFMYAVTGAWFGLGILVATSGAILYGCDRETYEEAMHGHRHDDILGPRIDLDDVRLGSYLDSASWKWEGFELTFIALNNVASQGMTINIYGEVDPKVSLFNYGELEFDVVSGRINHMHDPYHKRYEEVVSAFVHRIHFGYFGLEGWRHTVVKVLYFLLAIITCFVIITGVLIWLEARHKNNVPEKERKFNQGVGYVYLAICLSLLPVTALAFLASKLMPEHLAAYGGTIINSVFFGGWLLASVFFALKRNNSFTNTYTLLTGGILGLCIPLANGLVFHIIDILWLALSVSALTAVWLMESAPTRARKRK